MESSMLIKAIESDDRGWKVFSLQRFKNSTCYCAHQYCKNCAKCDRIKKWQDQCFGPSIKVKNWLQQCLEASIGNPLYFFIVDIDHRHGGKESLQQLLNDPRFSKALGSNTAGDGYLFLFNQPNIKITQCIDALSSIDIQGVVSYILVPPIYQQKCGAHYTWSKEMKYCIVQDTFDWLSENLGSSFCSDFDFMIDNPIRVKGGNDFSTRKAEELRERESKPDELLFMHRKVNASININDETSSIGERKDNSTNPIESPKYFEKKATKVYSFGSNLIADKKNMESIRNSDECSKNEDFGIFSSAFEILNEMSWHAGSSKKSSAKEKQNCRSKSLDNNHIIAPHRKYKLKKAMN